MSNIDDLKRAIAEVENLACELSIALDKLKDEYGYVKNELEENSATIEEQEERIKELEVDISEYVDNQPPI